MITMAKQLTYNNYKLNSINRKYLKIHFFFFFWFWRNGMLICILFYFSVLFITLLQILFRTNYIMYININSKLPRIYL